MKKNFAPFLPHELIVEILLRLPVKSLFRFKIVCKLWLSIINDPQFVERYFDLTGPRLLLRPTYYDSIDSLDIEGSLHNDSATVHLPLPLPPFPFFFDSLVIMGSCRGLMLLNYEENHDLFVWNPLIGVHKSIENYFHGIYNFMYGFGYDASTNDYLVVFLDLGFPEIPEEFPTELNLFSFTTNSWNLKIKYPHVRYRDLGDQFKAGSLLNDALHWLVLDFYDDREVLVIISFDLIQRSFSEIPLPCHLTKEPKFEIYSLRVLGECLSVCCFVQEDAACEIWVMKEYKVHSSWAKSFVLHGFDLPYNRFSPICVTKDGGILGSNVNGRLEKRNEKGELLEHLKFHRAQQLYGGNPQCAVYRGKIVSLPSNLGKAMWHGQQ